MVEHNRHWDPLKVAVAPQGPAQCGCRTGPPLQLPLKGASQWIEGIIFDSVAEDNVLPWSQKI